MINPGSRAKASGSDIGHVIPLEAASILHASGQRCHNAADKLLRHLTCCRTEQPEFEKLVVVLPLQSLMLQDHLQETMASWQAILGGLAEVCIGLAPDEDRGTSGSPHPCEGLFQDDDLVQLLDLCQTIPARILVLRIAAALSGSACAMQVQSRYSMYCAVLCWPLRHDAIWRSNA